MSGSRWFIDDPLNLILVRAEPGRRLDEAALFERRQVFSHRLCGPLPLVVGCVHPACPEQVREGQLHQQVAERGRVQHAGVVEDDAGLNYDEAAVIIGAAIGKPVRHVAIAPEQFRQAAAGWGASADFIDHYLEMVEGTSRPDAKAELRTPETTTPTTLAEWAGEVLAPLASG